MKRNRKCLTPGAMFHCIVSKPNAVGQTHIEMGVTLPPGIVVTPARARTFDKAFHDAMESAMASWFAERLA